VDEKYSFTICRKTHYEFDNLAKTNNQFVLGIDLRERLPPGIKKLQAEGISYIPFV